MSAELDEQKAFYTLQSKKEVSVVSPYNVLDSDKPFSLENYQKSVGILYALNKIRDLDTRPDTAQLTVNDIGFALDLKNNEPSTIVKYFSHIKDGCNFTGGGLEGSCITRMHILDDQIGFWYFPGNNCIHVEKPNCSPEAKPFFLDMREMEDVMASFDKLVKDSKEPKILPENNCVVDVSIDYISNGFNCGQISLLLGGKKNYLPETLIKPVAFREIHPAHAKVDM